MKYDNRPIGVFDSGLGGLTVVASLKKALPAEDIIYLGDTARVPYGDKSVENIIRFGHENSSFLLKKGVKAIIVACNTVSAIAIEQLREKYAPTPVIGVLEAGVSACIAKEPESITVIGTRATISSDAYRRNLHEVNPSIIVNSIACPLFVPLVEEGITTNKITISIIDYYLESLHTNPSDILLLGCTHYPLLAKIVKQHLPESIKIVDSASACALYAAEFLHDNNISASPQQHGSMRFYVTDMASDFISQASRFLNQAIVNVEKISLP